MRFSKKEKTYHIDNGKVMLTINVINGMDVIVYILITRDNADKSPAYQYR